MFLIFIFLSIPTVSKASEELNGNELEVIAYLKGTIVYEGKRYTVPAKYTNQAINYLKQDGVDLTGIQKEKFFEKAAGLIELAVKKGYLNLQNSDCKSIQKILISAEDLLEIVDCKMSYDVQKNSVNVVSEDGKTIMSLDPVIKNTGVCFNQSIRVCFGLIAAACICIYTAKKNDLFDYDDE